MTIASRWIEMLLLVASANDVVPISAALQRGLLNKWSCAPDEKPVYKSSMSKTTPASAPPPKRSRAPGGRDPAARDFGARDFELFDDLLPVRRYKLLLQTFLKRRGSGSRQAIAEALGNTRSFVTQITSPAYDLAIPAQHVRRIVELARLEPDEKRMFLDAYVEAHPERAADVLGPTLAEGARSVAVEVPTLATESAQRRLEETIQRVAAEIVAGFVEMEREHAQRRPHEDPETAA